MNLLIKRRNRMLNKAVAAIREAAFWHRQAEVLWGMTPLIAHSVRKTERVADLYARAMVQAERADRQAEAAYRDFSFTLCRWLKL